MANCILSNKAIAIFSTCTNIYGTNLSVENYVWLVEYSSSCGFQRTSRVNLFLMSSSTTSSLQLSKQLVSPSFVLALVSWTPKSLSSTQQNLLSLFFYTVFVQRMQNLHHVLTMELFVFGTSCDVMKRGYYEVCFDEDYCHNASIYIDAFMYMHTCIYQG